MLYKLKFRSDFNSSVLPAFAGGFKLAPEMLQLKYNRFTDSVIYSSANSLETSFFIIIIIPGSIVG